MAHRAAAYKRYIAKEREDHPHGPAMFLGAVIDTKQLSFQFTVVSLDDTCKV